MYCGIVSKGPFITVGMDGIALALELFYERR